MVKGCGGEVCPAASFTVTEMGHDPVAVGVPESTPSGPRTRPGGRVPVSFHAPSGGSPPVAVKVKLYGRFSPPADGAGLVRITGGGGLLMLSEKVLLTWAGGVSPSATVT